MSSDSLSSSALYRNRPEWKDVTPIYNSEREDNVIRIAATEEFVDAFAYFRAVLNSNEHSERAFELTKTCALLNAANYSVWQYRRNILKALNKEIKDELRFCEESAIENPKNYQIWHHRRVLVEMLNDPSMEIDFTSNLLDDDSKNYHAWQYRQWVVERFNLFSQSEVDFSTGCLLQDLRNNSAWNYRYFIMANLSDGLKNAEIINREVKFTIQCIAKIPNNESSWSYLSGILINEGLNMRKDVSEFCASLLSSDPPSKSVHLRNFCVDCVIEKLEKKEDVEKSLKKGHELLGELEVLDPIRTKYWRYRKIFIDNLGGAS